MFNKFFFIFFISTNILQAQNIDFTARADAKQVPLGETFDITFALQNEDLKNPQLPDFKEFTVISKPQKGSQFSYRQGVKILENNIFVRLQAKTLGLFTIAPAKILLNGKWHMTNPLTIEVVKKSAIQKAKKSSVFLRMETHQAKAYLGATITLDVKVFSNTANIDFEQVQEPIFEDFFAQKVSIFAQTPVKEIINGVQYQSQLLYRYILFPQKTGAINIKPFSIVADTAAEDASKSLLTINSNSLIINVINLPKNAPKEFSGAVGSFEMSAKISKNKLSTDDTLSLEVTIKGNGDAKRVNAPFFRTTDSVEIYDPKVTSEFNEVGFAKKVFQYVIVMKRAGKFNIEPMFTYFDTAQKKYLTLKNRQLVEIIQGNGKKNSEGVKDISNTDLKTFDWAVLGKLSLLSVLVTGFLLLFLNRRKKVENIDYQEFTKDFLSKKIQKNDLAIAHENLENNELNDFYKNISKALETQMKIFLNLEQASKTALLEKLAQSPKQHLQEDIQHIFQTCNSARFGGGLISANPQVVLAQVEKILAELASES